MAKAATESKNEEFVLECVGVLSNLHLADLDWAEIFKHFEMVTWVKGFLKSNNSEPDIIMQVCYIYYIYHGLLDCHCYFYPACPFEKKRHSKATSGCAGFRRKYFD